MKVKELRKKVLTGVAGEKQELKSLFAAGLAKAEKNGALSVSGKVATYTKKKGAWLEGCWFSWIGYKPAAQ